MTSLLDSSGALPKEWLNKYNTVTADDLDTIACDIIATLSEAHKRTSFGDDVYIVIYGNVGHVKFEKTKKLADLLMKELQIRPEPFDGQILNMEICIEHEEFNGIVYCGLPNFYLDYNVETNKYSYTLKYDTYTFTGRNTK